MPETLSPDYRAQALSLMPGTAYPTRMSALDMAAFTTITDNLWRASWYAFWFHGSWLRAQGTHFGRCACFWKGKSMSTDETFALCRNYPIIPVLAACSVVGGAFLFLLLFCFLQPVLCTSLFLQFGLALHHPFMGPEATS